MFSHKDVLPSGRILVFMITLGKTFFYLSVSTFIIASLVDPAIGAEGDVDTSIVTLTFENGAIGVIDNSRQAVYGYDQRLEVFGSEGAVQDENDIPNTVIVSRADGTSYGTAYQVMWDRYTQAFIDEMKAFADAVMNDKVPPITDLDGLYPVLMAAAANKSLKEGRPVKISEVDG